MIVVPFTVDDDVIESGDGGHAAATSGSACCMSNTQIETSIPAVLVEPIDPY